METRLCVVMSIQLCMVALLDMLNYYKYCPKVVIFQVGASYFMTVSAYQLHQNIQLAMSFNKQLLQTVQPYNHSAIGNFYSMLLKEPWYMGWDSHRAACHARSQFNGCLTKYAALHGSYLISHPTLGSEDYYILFAGWCLIPKKAILSFCPTYKENC